VGFSRNVKVSAEGRVDSENGNRLRAAGIGESEID